MEGVSTSRQAMGDSGLLGGQVCSPMEGGGQRTPRQPGRADWQRKTAGSQELLPVPPLLGGMRVRVRGGGNTALLMLTLARLALQQQNPGELVFYACNQQGTKINSNILDQNKRFFFVFFVWEFRHVKQRECSLLQKCYVALNKNDTHWVHWGVDP